MLDRPLRLSSSVQWLWVCCGLFLVFLASFTGYIRSQKRIDLANEARFESFRLADELRHSSDDLTRMARTYVATGDPSYKAGYEEILDIREGSRPRPLEAQDVYWDLVLADGRRPRPSGPAVPLVELMRKAGFTTEELARLEAAKAASDRLTKTEREAMALVEAPSPVADAVRLRATERLHGAAYHQAKAEIMGAIREFNAMVALRTSQGLQAAVTTAARIRFAVTLSGLVLVIMLGGLFSAIHQEKRKSSEQEAHFRAVFDNAAVGLAKISPEGRYLQVNHEFCRITGYSQDEVLGQGLTFQEITHPDDRPTDQANLERLIRGEEGAYPVTKRYIRKDGQTIWVTIFANAIREREGGRHSFISAIIDISSRKQVEDELERHKSSLEQLVEARTAELRGARNERLDRETAAHEQMIEALMESESRLRFIMENTRDVIWTLDLPTGRMTYISPSVTRLRGFTVEEALAQPLQASLTAESHDRVTAALVAALARWKAGDRSDSVHALEVDQPHKDGRILHTEIIATLHGDAEGNPSLVLGVTRDITERKRQEEHIRHLAFYDPLTQLPNRRFLLDRLQEAIARSHRDRSRVGLMFLDLDKFKAINDELGHEAGDWLLQSAARRLSACLRVYDIPARFGGDEFVVLLPGLDHPDDALPVAERVRAALEQPFIMDDGRVLDISASIGLALYPDHADNERDLMRLSDTAMYRAKTGGRNRVVLLRPDEGAALIRLTWEPAYACGHPAIDEEHRELFRLGNHLLECALAAGDDPAAFQGAIQELKEHVALHFQHEEAILGELGYPGLAEHAVLHRALLNRAETLCQRPAEEVPVGEIVDFLAVQVVSKHLLQADRAFFSLFAGNRP